MSKKPQKKAAAQAATEEESFSLAQALRDDISGNGRGRVSRSGRPVYHPSTTQWVCVAMALVFALAGLSMLNEGNTQQGIFCIIFAVLAGIAFAVLTINRRKGQ